MNILSRWNLRRKLASSECVRVADILQQYLDGEGTPAEAERVERHLDECTDCGIESEALKDLKDAVRRHGAADEGSRDRLQSFAERLARGDICSADEPTS